jgi:hypothetical protein
VELGAAEWRSPVQQMMSIKSRDWLRMERRVVKGVEEEGLHYEEGEVEAGVGAETEGEGLPFMYISALLSLLVLAVKYCGKQDIGW